MGAHDATNAYEGPDVGHPHIVVDVVYISLDASWVQRSSGGLFSLDGKFPFGRTFRRESLKPLVYFKGLIEVTF
jgi:hypothetical protein